MNLSLYVSKALFSGTRGWVSSKKDMLHIRGAYTGSCLWVYFPPGVDRMWTPKPRSTSTYLPPLITSVRKLCVGIFFGDGSDVDGYYA